MARKEMTSGQLRILQAVARLLENPANKITVQRIAQEIHVTDGAIYRHYKSKDDIFEAIAAYMESNLLGPLNTAHKQEDRAERRLSFVFEQHMTFLEGHPGLARMLIGGGSTEAAPLAERLKLLNAKVRSQIAQLYKMAEAQDALAHGISPEQSTELYHGLLAATAVSHAFGLPQVNAASKWSALHKSTLRSESRA
jgi:TetR/AcrR family transcriptional regulator